MADTRNERVLAAFSAIATQRTDRARLDPPLERLFALFDEDDRQQVIEALNDLRIRPGRHDTTSQRRNRRSDIGLWGISPFF